VQDVDGGGVGCEDCGEALVAVGGLVEAAAAEDDVSALQPGFHHLGLDEAFALDKVIHLIPVYSKSFVLEGRDARSHNGIWNSIRSLLLLIGSSQYRRASRRFFSFWIAGTDGRLGTRLLLM
jgi:hypothetical protein